MKRDLTRSQRLALADAYAAFHRDGLRQTDHGGFADPTLQSRKEHDLATIMSLIDRRLLVFWGDLSVVHVTARGAVMARDYAGCSTTECAGVPPGDAVSNPPPAPFKQ